MNDLPTLPERSAIALRELIARGEISPRELMAACIERMQALNLAVNALAQTNFEAAMAQAVQAEAQALAVRARKRTGPQGLGLLHGLPLGVKDLQNTAGLRTTFGNIGFRNHVPQHDVALVAQIKAAGAIVAAKTNVPDMGAGANTRNAVWGATGNPFNTRLNAGGSSGGSAAALATSMLPLCTGSDTGGSLRIPAALCGVVGLRPSPGLVPNDDRALGWSVISVLGPMGRSVADTALLMAASVGSHHLDPLSAPLPAQSFFPLPECDLSRLRVGTTEDFGLCLVSQATRQVFRQRVAAIAPKVALCEPVQLELGDADRAFDVLRAEAFVAGFSQTLKTAAETLGPNVRANLEMAASISLADRAWAHLQQTKVARAFATAFERYDVIVSPVTPLTPFPWEQLYATHIDGQALKNYYHWLALTYIVTLATCPALSLPCGRDEAGMPFGLQMMGPLRGDAQLLAAAAAMEQAFAREPSLNRPRPDLKALLAQTPERSAALKSLVTHAPQTLSEQTQASASPMNAV